MKKILKIITLAALNASLIAGIIACAKTKLQTSNGGQDSGGGNTTQSSLKDVEDYYEKAQKDLPIILEEFLNSIFKTKNHNHLIKDMKSRVATLSQRRDTSTGIDNLIKASTINIKKYNSCISSDKSHAYGSIKEFKVGSDICISFYELTKVPNSSLEREIISLLLHEYAHALGFAEKDAAEIQLALAQNFDLFSKKLYVPSRDKQLFSDVFTSKYFIEEVLDSISEKKTVTTKDWIVACSIIYSVDTYLTDLQNRDISYYNNRGSALINYGYITEIQITNHLDKVDNAYTKTINTEADLYLKYCTHIGRPTKDFKKRVKQLQVDLSHFYELIDETEGYMQPR